MAEKDDQSNVLWEKKQAINLGRVGYYSNLHVPIEPLTEQEKMERRVINIERNIRNAVAAEAPKPKPDYIKIFKEKMKELVEYRIYIMKKSNMEYLENQDPW